jgi:hypothetical protein
MSKARLFDAAEYLDSPETITAYLAEAFESDDPSVVATAEEAAARARENLRRAPAMVNSTDSLSAIEQYEAALKEIEVYFNNVPAVGTEAAARFEFLSALIKRFEDIHFPIGDGSPRRTSP